MCFTGNPVMDAENYQLHHMRDDEDSIQCDYCHGPIYKANSRYEGDRYYELNGLDICENCVGSYLRDIAKECM